MKHFSLALSLAALLLASCVNDTPTPPAPSPESIQAPAAPVILNKTQVEQGVGQAKALVTHLDNMIKEVEALPAEVKQKNAQEVEDLRTELSGSLGKHQFLVDELVTISQNIDSPPKGMQTSATSAAEDMSRNAKMYMEQIEQSNKALEQTQEHIKKLAGKN